MAVGGWGFIQIFEINNPQSYLQIFKTWGTVFKMMTIFDHKILLCTESNGYVELIDLKKGVQAKHIQIESSENSN